MQWSFLHPKQTVGDNIVMWYMRGGLHALLWVLISSQNCSKRCLGLYWKYLRFHSEILSLINSWQKTFTNLVSICDSKQQKWPLAWRVGQWVSHSQEIILSPSREEVCPYISFLRKHKRVCNGPWGRDVHQSSKYSARTGYYRSKENYRWKYIIFLEK